MKNVMVWVINEEFRGDHWRYKDDREKIFNYIRLQIENSLYFNWQIKDIVLITNFDFEYMGVKSYILPRDICKWSAFANKLVAVNEMIKKGVIDDDFWLHDVDAYQLIPFEFPQECKDWGYTRHDPNRGKPQGGSGFYRKSAFDIVDSIANLILITKTTREEKFLPLFVSPGGSNRTLKLEAAIKNHKIKSGDQYNRLVAEYDIGKKAYGVYSERFSYLNYCWDFCIVHQFNKKYPQTVQPIKIAHFHPEYIGCYDCFIMGKNKYNAKISTPYLDELLYKHKLIVKAQ